MYSYTGFKFNQLFQRKAAYAESLDQLYPATSLFTLKCDFLPENDLHLAICIHLQLAVL